MRTGQKEEPPARPEKETERYTHGVYEGKKERHRRVDRSLAQTDIRNAFASYPPHAAAFADESAAEESRGISVSAMR